MVGPGAILEAIGCFEDLRINDKGLATVSNDDCTFECHVKLGAVRSAQFATKESPQGRTMHIVRLLGADDATLLSAILQPDEPGGEVEEGAIQFFEKLRNKFGERPALVSETPA